MWNEMYPGDNNGVNHTNTSDQNQSQNMDQNQNQNMNQNQNVYQNVYQNQNQNMSGNTGNYDHRNSSTDRNSGRRGKKGTGFFGRLMTCVAFGLFFGLFAGVSFFGVQYLLTGVTGIGSSQSALGQNVEISEGDGVEESKSGIKLTDTTQISVVTSDVTEVVDEVMPAMVSIINNYLQTGTTFFGQTYTEEVQGSGTGFIVAESETELLIVTNYHVIEGTNQLDVTFIDGTVAQAQVKGTDSDMDLAVIAVALDALSEETKAAIAISTMGDSDALKLGEPVIAIGNALGYGQSVTNGIVSALNREITVEEGSTGTFIQTNAAINPGNSGGALLNVKGEVIGINSNKIGATVVEGMGYAIPISAAKPIIAELMLKETRTKVEDGQIGYMGITMQTVTSQFSQMYNMPQGIYVIGVEEGSPAEEAGFLAGDIIAKFEGEKISDHDDLIDIMQYYKAGSQVVVTVERPTNGKYVTTELTVILGERPADLQ